MIRFEKKDGDCIPREGVLFRSKKWLMVLAGCLAVNVYADGGDSAALINALVKKGVLTSQEGAEVRAEIQEDNSTMPGGFLTVGSSAVRGLRLYGDIRLRYEYDQQEQKGNDVRERNRNRYRVRLGAEYVFTDGFSSGIRLATGQARNSTNADFATGEPTFGVNDSIYVDLAYLSLDHPFGLDWLSMSAGRILQPHNIVMGWTWDSDINPDGGVIKFGSWKPIEGLSIASSHGAYIWTDAANDNPFGSSSQGLNDVWMFINQVDFTYTFSKEWKLRVSPSFVSSIGDGRVGQNPSTTDLNDVSDLNVFLLDAQLDTPFFFQGTRGRLYGEYGVNVTADSMGKRLLTNYDSGDNQFFLLGYQVIKGQGKGSWVVDLTYAYYEALSWSGALTDSDWNGGKLNGQGLGLKVTYGLTDNVSTSVNWRKSWAVDKNLTGPAAGDLGGNLKATDLVQVDLNWKF